MVLVTHGFRPSPWWKGKLFVIPFGDSFKKKPFPHECHYVLLLCIAWTCKTCQPALSSEYYYFYTHCCHFCFDIDFVLYCVSAS